MAEDMTWKKLCRLNTASAVPFQIKLQDQEEPLICEQIVRVLPGKRVVAFGTFDNKPVVAKLFYEPGKAKKHFKREAAGIEILTVHRIPTATILREGHAFKKRVYVMIFERIMDAKSLDDIWREKNSPQELIPLLHAVTLELATHHVMGIEQNDLHLKNMLVQGNHIYTLDGGSVTCIEQPLDKKSSLDNLALFFSQLGVGTEKIQQELFQAYTRARGWLVKPADISYLQNAVEYWNDTRWRQYETKIFRSCTAFGKIFNPQVLTMYDRDYKTPAFSKMLAHPEDMFTLPDTKVLKAGRSATVIDVLIDNKRFVIKRYNIKNFWHWLRRAFRPTRAASCWRLAHLLRLFGIPTARPVAFIEKRFIGLRRKSYFIMEYVEGQDLGNFFADYAKQDPHDPHYVKVAVRVAALLMNLAKLFLSHGDLKMTNILVKDERPVLIDLDGMEEHRTQGETGRAYRREVRRFMRNWENNPSVMGLFEKLLQE